MLEPLLLYRESKLAAVNSLQLHTYTLTYLLTRLLIRHKWAKQNLNGLGQTFWTEPQDKLQNEGSN